MLENHIYVLPSTGPSRNFCYKVLRSCYHWWTLSRVTASLSSEGQSPRLHMKPECMSYLTHTCLLTTPVNIMLPLLKHKSIKKPWLAQKTSLYFKEATMRHCKASLNAEWLLQGKQPHIPSSQGH